jgi:PST family polysaccharide transporter
MAMAVLVTNFLETIRDVGTGQALIREKEVSHDLASTVSWLNWGLGAIVALFMALIAWPAARFFHEPQLVRILQILSLSFFMGAISVVPRALLSREMAFRELALAQTAGAIIGTVVAIVIALAGGKVWSLVFGALANSLVTTLAILYFCPLRLGGAFRPSAAKHVMSFGLNLSGYQILNYLSRNADNLLVGRFLGKGPLGIYQMAYTFVTYPILNFTIVMGQVVYPALSKFHDDHERFRAAYLRTCRIIALATFPIMLGLAVTAVPFVRVFLGARWMPVAPLLMIFAPLGALQSITIVALIYNTQGRADLNLRWTLFASSMYVLSFLVGLHWGVLGVATAYSIVWTLLMIPSLLIPFRLINLSAKDYFLALWPTTWMSLAMAALCEAWLVGLRRLGLQNAALQCVSAALIGALFYVALVLWKRPPVLAELVGVVQGSSHPLARFLARSISRFTPKNPNMESDAVVGSSIR